MIWTHKVTHKLYFSIPNVFILDLYESVLIYGTNQKRILQILGDSEVLNSLIKDGIYFEVN